jgi:hypothetical protein
MSLRLLVAGATAVVVVAACASAQTNTLPPSGLATAWDACQLSLKGQPAPYRALTVRNLDAWYSTFDVKPGQTLSLAPAERVKIW